MTVLNCTCGHPGLTYDGPREDCPIHGREHLCYADENGNAEECIEDCPGCHYEGNAGCDSWPDCDLCNPDGYGWVFSL